MARFGESDFKRFFMPSCFTYQKRMLLSYSTRIPSVTQPVSRQNMHQEDSERFVEGSDVWVSHLLGSGSKPTQGTAEPVNPI